MNASKFVAAGRAWCRTKQARTVAALLVAVAALLAVYGAPLLAHMKMSAEQALLNDDARQQIYPFFRYEDAELFVGDFVADYYLAALPLGYRALYTMAGFLGGVVFLSKFIVHALLFVTVAAVGVAAYRFSGSVGACASMAIALTSPLYLDRMGGGLPRAFAFPLIACVLAALVWGRMRMLSVLVCVAAAFYPAAAVLAGLSLACVLLLFPSKDRGDAKDWTLGRRWICLVVTAAMAALLLLPSVLAASPFGPIITSSQTAEYPEAGPGGRYGAESRAPFSGFFEGAGIVLEKAVVGDHAPWSKKARAFLDAKDRGVRGTPSRRSMLLDVVLALSIAGWIVLLRRRSEARRLVALAAAAFTGYVIARLIPPFFYLPQRYLMYPIPPMVAVVIPSAIVGLWPAARRGRYTLPCAAMVGGYALALLLCVGGTPRPRAGLTVRAAQRRGNIYEAIAKLPKKARVAGWPRGVMDNVPYVTRRQALLTFETHQAFHVAFVKTMRVRMRALVDAYFATSVEPILRLRDDFGVTHMVVELAHLRGSSPRYFRPFSGWAKEAIRRKGRGTFELMRMADSAAIFRDRSRVLIDLSLLGERPR